MASESVHETRFLRFVLKGSSDSGRTNRYEVQSRSSGDVLALIAWYGPWRCYTADFSDMATFNSDCLTDIAAFLSRETAKHRKPVPTPAAPAEEGK